MVKLHESIIKIHANARIHPAVLRGIEKVSTYSRTGHGQKKARYGSGLNLFSLRKIEETDA